MASREESELSEESFYESLLGKGVSDPDFVGYPGETIIPLVDAGLEKVILW